MRRISKYWIFQITGWGCFAGINIYLAILTHDLNRNVILTNVWIALIGLSLTHLFRRYILRHQLLKQRTEALVWKMAAGVFILSLFFNLLYYAGLTLWYETDTRHLRAADFLGSVVSSCFLFTIWVLIYFAWTYVESNRRNLIERLTLETNMKDLELKTIRSRLQPHFLFNSLNSIRALISENPELARKAITQLSNILRYTIREQDSTETLEKELLLVNDYLALEKIRFEEKLQLHEEISESTLQILIPAMMLQTLVENAIKHGLSRLEKGGVLHIRSRLENQLFILEVGNTGSLTTGSDQETGLGFGLHATKQRLHLIYGSKAQFSLTEEPGMVWATLKLLTS